MADPSEQPRHLGRGRVSRTALVALLESRRDEIQEAILARISALSDLREPGTAYSAGLHEALSTALNHGLDVIEQGEEHSPSIPSDLLGQARLAACSGVSLGTVLRHYIVGHTILTDFILGEADNTALDGVSLQRITRDIAAAFDRLLNAVTEEHTRESTKRLSSKSERRAERVRRLLAGELLDTSQLAYDLDGWHVGAAAQGPKAGDALRELAATLGQPLLSVRGDHDAHWAWFGSRHRLCSGELKRISNPLNSHNSLGLGEPAQGRMGWRLTHKQARAALTIASRGPERLVRYVDVALLASVIHDDLLTTSLRALYLIPLSEERDGGVTLRETLRAYLSTQQNVSSAAATLGVSRRTVTNRLNAIEARLGRPLAETLTEMDTALRLEDLDLDPRRDTAIE